MNITSRLLGGSRSTTPTPSVGVASPVEEITNKVFMRKAEPNRAELNRSYFLGSRGSSEAGITASSASSSASRIPSPQPVIIKPILPNTPVSTEVTPRNLFTIEYDNSLPTSGQQQQSFLTEKHLFK